MNTFGNIFRLTTFGESHGVAVGGVIDGMPSVVEVDMDLLRREMERRRPGRTVTDTQRKESDEVEILSGVFEGKTTGQPISFIIRNRDARSEDYAALKDVFREGHADRTYQEKYGIRDYRGGGRASARETACRVVGGAFAKMVLNKLGISICAETENEAELQKRIEEARQDGDTVGGVISCTIHGCPAGLGEPVYGKLHAALGAAMLSINAVKGFEYGEGFRAAEMRGSEHNKANQGGILGGISNGEDITFRVAFKPIATLAKEVKGRHDTCPVPRAVPIVEAMAAMVILDFWMAKQASRG